MLDATSRRAAAAAQVGFHGHENLGIRTGVDALQIIDIAVGLADSATTTEASAI